jgi:mRNA export factor
MANKTVFICCSVLLIKKAVSPWCVQFWDTRSPNPMLSIELPERAYCADVDFPMAVVGTAGRGIIIYQLDGQPKEFKKVPRSVRHS